MDNIVTADLSEFGHRELREASELLNAYIDQSASFLGDGVTLNFNRNSGCVFLSDESFNVGMLNDGKLEQWFSCPYCGHEGFIEDMRHEPEDKECIEYMLEIGCITEEEAERFEAYMEI